MDPIRFIHAADLHLDTPFSGISRGAPAELVSLLQEATFVALRRLVDLCQQERPAFLLLSGDVYNQEDKSLRAQLALHDGCVRLREEGVQVFIVNGNHDPLSSRLQTVRWPENVTLFGEEAGAVPVYSREGLPIAVIHGISHTSNKETRNLAVKLRRSDGIGAEGKEADCLHVGLLHATPGDVESGARYAPFSLGDLSDSGMDYWALGHIHERRELCRKPLCMYSGCTQGLHINETGEKGCLLVSALPAVEGGYVCSVAFRPLGPVIWRNLSLTLEDPVGGSAFSDEMGDEGLPASLTLDDLESQLRLALETEAAKVWTGCRALIVRIHLSGRTALNNLLRRESACSELVERLRDALGNSGTERPFVWIKDIVVDTRPPLDRATLTAREDLLGEILRLGDECRVGAENLATLRETALCALYTHPRARKIVEQPDDVEFVRWLDDAESLCLDLLEND